MINSASTAVRYFIAVSADAANRDAIHGLGNTAEEAIADAVQSSGLVSNVCDENDGFRGNWGRDAYGEIIEEIYVAQECTEELYDFVKREGGAGISWDDTGRVADVEVSEGDVDTVVDHVTAGMEGNRLHNASPIAGWDASTALDTYTDFNCTQDEMTSWQREITGLLSSAALRSACIAAIQEWIDEQSFTAGQAQQVADWIKDGIREDIRTGGSDYSDWNGAEGFDIYVDQLNGGAADSSEDAATILKWGQSNGLRDQVIEEIDAWLKAEAAE